MVVVARNTGVSAAYCCKLSAYDVWYRRLIHHVTLNNNEQLPHQCFQRLKDRHVLKRLQLSRQQNADPVTPVPWICVCARRLATTILIRVHLYPPHRVCARHLVTTVPIQCRRLATCCQRLAKTTLLHPNARHLAINHQNFSLLQVLRRILHLLLHQYENNSWHLLRCQFETNSWLTCTSKL